ncbi:putative PAS/PAC sensor protein [Haladaptatus paucihalophilus DX253]|uniref:HTH DNA binding domain-containing protein n=1 Tax=Haladaptatus paucihalophilus DX253 TaxID=797209 RepID=E7QXJ2_HALPU|nr:bacterio-opsin activator domain-containing protein [Haladaptatus paucihalophilus]EFW90995.1 putative PAS/PAC sensor protein [Haladaptatus paucihalophilus DX253]SHK28680.1 HTH DNA binding domain-containing protein [Haladaptatus paucihalophilus DX253]
MTKVSRRDLLDVFSRADDPHAPLTTSEIASALGRVEEQTLERLRTLADDGLLQTRTVADTHRVWWPPCGRSDCFAENDRPTDGHPRIRTVFRSTDLAEPFRELANGSLFIEIDSVVHLSEGEHLQYWTATGISAEALLETVMEFPATLDARLLSTVNGTHRVESHSSFQSLLSIFGEFDGKTKSATYDEQEIRIVAEFPPSVDTERVQAVVRDVYPDLELVSTCRVITSSFDYHLIEEKLTERQLTALQMSYFSGYFEQPRKCSGVVLAERMGISKQAFHEHLRKAYDTVFEQLFTNVDETTVPDQ